MLSTVLIVSINILALFSSYLITFLAGHWITLLSFYFKTILPATLINVNWFMSTLYVMEAVKKIFKSDISKISPLTKSQIKTFQRLPLLTWVSWCTVASPLAQECCYKLFLAPEHILVSRPGEEYPHTLVSLLDEAPGCSSASQFVLVLVCTPPSLLVLEPWSS